jgi:hypothetical protein
MLFADDDLSAPQNDDVWMNSKRAVEAVKNHGINFLAVDFDVGSNLYL